MFTEGICPVCQALQDPTTGKCLVCGRTYHVLVGEPLPLDGYNRLQYYAIPVQYQNRMGYLTLCGEPKLSYDTLISGEKRVIFTIEAYPEADSQLFSVFF